MWYKGQSTVKGASNLVKGIRGHLPEEVISFETYEVLPGEGLLKKKKRTSALVTHV